MLKCKALLAIQLTTLPSIIDHLISMELSQITWLLRGRGVNLQVSRLLRC